MSWLFNFYNVLCSEYNKGEIDKATYNKIEWKTLRFFCQLGTALSHLSVSMWVAFIGLAYEHVFEEIILIDMETQATVCSMYSPVAVFWNGEECRHGAKHKSGIKKWAYMLSLLSALELGYDVTTHVKFLLPCPLCYDWP